MLDKIASAVKTLVDARSYKEAYELIRTHGDELIKETDFEETDFEDEMMYTNYTHQIGTMLFVTVTFAGEITLMLAASAE